MFPEASKQFGSYLISESQHYAMNILMNSRYTIQKKLEPILGQKRARKTAQRIVILVERLLKSTLYQFARSNT